MSAQVLGDKARNDLEAEVEKVKHDASKAASASEADKKKLQQQLEDSESQLKHAKEHIEKLRGGQDTTHDELSKYAHCTTCPDLLPD